MVADSSSDQSQVIQASEILAKIERGEPVACLNKTIEGDLTFRELSLCTKNCGFVVDRQRGFTLIALLIAIVIIAEFMSILMPALGYVRQQARAGACRSNLHQLCTVMNLYALDHEDRTMPFSHQPGEAAIVPGLTRKSGGV